MTTPRNEPCWCGSGLKYKRCHLDRDRQTPPTPQEVQEQIRRIFSEKLCLHPDAPDGCGSVIRAHSIQRHGALDRIARDGHVYALRARPACGPTPFPHPVEAKLVGIRDASTFQGYCGRHDNELFAVIEKRAFELDTESALLIGYRALSYGYYHTLAGERFLEYLRLVDRGQPEAKQVAWQKYVDGQRERIRASIVSAKAQRAAMAEQFSREDFSDVRYYAIELSRTPCIAATFGWHPTHDFEDRELTGPATDPIRDILLWSVIPMGKSGVCVFVWLRDQPACTAVVRSFDALPDDRLADATMRFSSLCENTYFSPTWWDGTSEVTKRLLCNRLAYMIDPRPIAPTLKPDAMRLADWGAVVRKTNLSRAILGGPHV